MYIDVHCHLDKEYYDDITDVVNSALSNDVKLMIYNGCNVKTNLEVIDVINKFDNVYGAVGFHPTELNDISDDDYVILENMLSNKKIVAIGEIGLDYHYDNTDRKKQRYHFIKQLELAEKYKLPVIIHSRDSIQDTYNILKEYKVKGVMHCFSGSLEMAREFVKLGYFISVGGIITFKNAKNIINVINNIDLSYILLETDSPYLSPEPYRGKKNEPKNIPIIASKIAEIRGVSLETIRDVTSGNACGLFDFFSKLC